MEQSLSASSSSSSSSSSSWWPTLLLVTCAAVAFGSVNFVRQAFSRNDNDGDDEVNEGFTINAVAAEGFNVKLGFGIHRFGVDLHLGYAHTRFGGNYNDVILGTPALLIVRGADLVSSSGRRLALDSAAVEAQIAE